REGQDARAGQRKGSSPQAVREREVHGFGAVAERDRELLGDRDGHRQGGERDDVLHGPRGRVGQADPEREGAGCRGRKDQESGRDREGRRFPHEVSSRWSRSRRSRSRRSHSTSSRSTRYYSKTCCSTRRKPRSRNTTSTATRRGPTMTSPTTAGPGRRSRR